LHQSPPAAQPQPRSLSVSRLPSGQRGPAACLLHLALVSRWRGWGRCLGGRGASRAGRVGRAGRPQHGVARWSVEKPFDFPILCHAYHTRRSLVQAT